MQGEITIGLYAISPCTQRCKWVAIDADYKNAMEDLLKLQYYLWQDKVEPALEMSKRGAIFGFCWKGRCWQRTAESTFTIWRGGWGCQQRVPAWGRASKYFPGIVRLVKEGLAMPFAALWGFIEGPAAFLVLWGRLHAGSADGLPQPPTQTGRRGIAGIHQRQRNAGLAE